MRNLRLWLFGTLLLASQALAQVQRVDSIGITVTDMDRSLAFYRDALSFTAIDDREVAGEEVESLFGLFGVRLRVVRMRLGNEHIELMQFLAPRGRPYPVDSRSNDHWFQHIAIIVADMDKAYQHLRRHRVEHASSGPQRLPDWNPNAGGIEAFYFRDPDGNHLEILAFPKGKGDAKWQDKSKLFLGIDHTAIVVADTQQSLRYYRDTLGMQVVGSSENWGTEQAHLNNVFGAHLQITALRADDGPGVELLEYLAPQGGRPMPDDTRASDLWYWQINFDTKDLAQSENDLDQQGYSGASATPVILPTSLLGFPSAYLARDTDGHASVIRARN